MVHLVDRNPHGNLRFPYRIFMFGINTIAIPENVVYS